MNLTKEQEIKYSRQIRLDEIGEEGQKKLLSSKVLIIGTGGLGSPAAMYLAAAGIGTIGIADADEVDLSNLQRQIIHSANNVGVKKVKSASERIREINPDVVIKTYDMFVTSENIDEILSGYDFILDCTDNFEAKFLINDACVKNEKPFCHAGIKEFKGQIMTYVPGKGANFRDIFHDVPAGNAPSKPKGPIGAVAGIIGTLEAMEAVKYIIGIGELLTGYLLTFDALNAEFRKIKLPCRK